jgi:CheY-like chemotaxis protein
MSAHVVVIDDEPELRMMLLDFLEANGISATGISRPELVHTMDRSQPPDLFLVDLILPGQTGIELAEQLRAEGYAETPMIAMSASRPMLQAALKSNLFQQVLPKPFNILSLLDYVERYAG